MSLDPAWLQYPLMLGVNMLLMISVDGGPWHGKAVYVETVEGGEWTLLYHYKGDMNKLKQTDFKQIKKNQYLFGIESESSIQLPPHRPAEAAVEHQL